MLLDESPCFSLNNNRYLFIIFNPESEDEAQAEKSDGTDDTPVNPYPVTIIPKYGAASQAKPATKLGKSKKENDTRGQGSILKPINKYSNQYNFPSIMIR